MSLDQDLVAAALPLYEVHSELGRGAWGVVLAGHHRQLGRDVAIKQLPRAFAADPAVRARFLGEARLLASLNHTHIVPIYDFVEHEGLCLLVMERLTGGTVWSQFQAGAFTPERSCAVALATCSALHYAHQRSVLHRDVKPENLLFSAEGILKVTDFGIAKVVGGPATVATRSGDVLGTPDYMAPEQAQGGVLGPPTDVYAVGMVLYELLSGRLPFPVDSNPVATLYRHVHEPARPLGEAAPDLPAGLVDVTTRALQTDPGRRYPDAETFGVALGEAAAEAWGPGWLGETGVTVAAPVQMLGAATGQPRRVSAGATGAEPVLPREDASAASAAATPADLVPVNVLRPELAAPAADGRAAPTIAPRREPSQGAAPPGGGPPSAPGDSSPASPPAVTPSPPASSGHRRSVRSRRIAVAAVIGVVGVGIVAVAVALLTKKDPAHKVTAGPRATTPSTTIVALQPVSWRGLHDAPTARQQLAAATAEGTIWVFGGLTGETSTAKVEGYDPAINTWKSGPDLPLPLHHEMAATYHDELVVLGGWVPDGPNLTATVSDKVYALRNGNWVELPHLIHPRAAGAVAAVGDQLIAFGGQADGQLVPSTEVFDGNHWFESAPLPTPRDHLAGASDGRYAYAVGGRELSADKNLGSFERYDPVSGRWETLALMPTPRGGLAAAVVGGRLVTVGGESVTGVFDTVEMYDLSNGSWSAGPPMRTPRHGLAVAILGTSLYALDGASQPSHAASTPVAEALDF